jgi:VWFA-related protein
LQEVQKAVQKADVIFYSVNPGGPSVKLNQIAMRAESGMEAIAETTGGTAFVPDSDLDLERVFRQVAAELRGQYLLQYYANSEAPAGQFRRIKLQCPHATTCASAPARATTRRSKTRQTHCRFRLPILFRLNRQFLEIGRSSLPHHAARPSID